MCISNWDELKTVIQSLASTDLFVALWSLSETPVRLSESVRNLLRAKQYCIAFQERFNEVDNLKDYGDGQKHHRDLHWQQVAIPHLPGNYYLWNLP